MPMAHDNPKGKLRFILVEREGVQDENFDRERRCNREIVQLYLCDLFKEGATAFLRIPRSRASFYTVNYCRKILT